MVSLYNMAVFHQLSTSPGDHPTVCVCVGGGGISALVACIVYATLTELDTNSPGFVGCHETSLIALL